MRDAYVGDIGDYGKYGLLRKIDGFTLAINWYKVTNDKIALSKHNDGKHIDYLKATHKYYDEFCKYDEELFLALQDLVGNNSRKIHSIENTGFWKKLPVFFNDEVGKSHADREIWHCKALTETSNADIVFLDPDNGLRPQNMHKNSVKHVYRDELGDYYKRGQTVIIYQHRPQDLPKTKLIDFIGLNALDFRADHLFCLEFPRNQVRYMIFFCHEKHAPEMKRIARDMAENWQKICTYFELV